MKTAQKSTHHGFIRQSGVLIFLMFLGNLFEVGFNGVAARLPEEGGYSTFGALFNIFFIIIAPLTSIQMIVSKEVSSYIALGEHGKARSFVELSFRYVAVFSFTIVFLGLIGSRFIVGFLQIGNLLPVILLMVTLGVYSPFPVLFGTTQGLKKFLPLGLVHFSWCFSRFFFAALMVLVLSRGLNELMFGVVAAVVVTTFIAWLPSRSLFSHTRMNIDRREILTAYGLISPIIITLFCVAVLKNADIVLANKFFDSGIADAYTCAARVGSGFFMLTGVILVMFPHVSEEKTHSGNPIVFLLKSFVVTVGLSALGILVAWFFPGIVMKLITVGGTIPGAEPLIRIIGFAVLPLSLVYIMSNYLLAKHSSGFLPILVCGMLLQIFLISTLHQTPFSMIVGIGVANTLTCIVMFIYIFKEHREYMKTLHVGLDRT